MLVRLLMPLVSSNLNKKAYNTFTSANASRRVPPHVIYYEIVNLFKSEAFRACKTVSYLIYIKIMPVAQT